MYKSCEYFAINEKCDVNNPPINILYLGPDLSGP